MARWERADPQDVVAYSLSTLGKEKVSLLVGPGGNRTAVQPVVESGQGEKRDGGNKLAGFPCGLESF